MGGFVESASSKQIFRDGFKDRFRDEFRDRFTDVVTEPSLILKIQVQTPGTIQNCKIYLRT